MNVNNKKSSTSRSISQLAKQINQESAQLSQQNAITTHVIHANLAPQQKVPSQADLYTLTQKLTALYKEKMQAEMKVPAATARDPQTSRIENEKNSTHYAPPFNISPKTVARNQSFSKDKSFKSPPKLNQMLDRQNKSKNSVIKNKNSKISTVNHSKERKLNQSLTKRPQTSISTQKAISTEIRGHKSKVITTQVILQNKQQYLTSNRSKPKQPQHKFVSSRQSSTNKINTNSKLPTKTQKQNQKRDLSDKSVKNLHDSLNYLNSQEPIQLRNDNSFDVDYSAIIGPADVNQSQITYRTNNDGHNSSMINIKDHSVENLLRQVDSTNHITSQQQNYRTSISKHPFNVEQMPLNQSDIMVFNSLNGGSMIENTPIISKKKISKSKDRLSSGKRSKATSKSRLRQEPSFDSRDNMKNYRDQEYEKFPFDQASLLSKQSQESSMQFNQLLQFTKSLNEQVDSLQNQKKQSDQNAGKRVKSLRQTMGSRGQRQLSQYQLNQPSEPIDIQINQEIAQYKNQVANLKYDLSVLTQKLNEKENGQVQNMYEQDKLNDLLQNEKIVNKQLSQKLRKLEDKHQEGVLQKSEIIKDLTNKLKQSTKIISQLYEAAAKKDIQMKEAYKSNILANNQQLEQNQLRELQIVKEDYENQIIELKNELLNSQREEHRLREKLQENISGSRAVDIQKIRELQLKLEENQIDFKNLQDHMQLMKESYNQQSTQINSLNIYVQKVERLEKEQKAWIIERKQFESKLKMSEEQYEQLKKDMLLEIQILNQKNESLEEQLENQNEQIDHKDENAKLLRQIALLEQEVLDMQNNQQQKIGQLTQETDQQKSFINQKLQSMEQDLSQQIQKLTQKDQELLENQDQLKYLEEENENLNQQIEEINRKVNSKDKQIQQMEQQLKMKQDEISRGHMQSEDKHKQLESHSKQLDDLQNSFNQYQEEIAQREKETEELNDQINRFQQTIAQMQNESTIAQQKYQNQVNESEQYRMQLDHFQIEQKQQELLTDQYKDRIAQLEEFDRQKTEAIQAIQDSRDSLATQVEKLTKQIDEKESKIVEIQNELSQLNESHSQKLNSLVISHQSSFSDLQTQNSTQLQQQIDQSAKLQSENAVLIEQLDQLKQTIKDNEKLQNTQKEEIQKQQQKIINFEQKLNETRKVISDKDLQIEQNHISITDLQQEKQQLQKYKDENKQKQTVIDSKIVEINQLEKVIQQLQSGHDQITSLTEQNRNLSKQVSDKTLEIQELQNTIQKVMENTSRQAEESRGLHEQIKLKQSENENFKNVISKLQKNEAQMNQLSSENQDQKQVIDQQQSQIGEFKNIIKELQKDNEYKKITENEKVNLQKMLEVKIKEIFDQQSIIKDLKKDQDKLKQTNKESQEKSQQLNQKTQEVIELKKVMQEMQKDQDSFMKLTDENKIYKTTIEDMAKQIMIVEEQKTNIKNDLLGKQKQIDEKLNVKKLDYSQQTTPKSDKEKIDLNKNVEKLQQEKEELTKLIFNMRKSLKGVRKVFLDQVVREGVETQNQLSIVLQSQSHQTSFLDQSIQPDINNSKLLTIPSQALDSSDDEINLSIIQKTGRQSGNAITNSQQQLNEKDVENNMNVSQGKIRSHASSSDNSLNQIRHSPSVEVSAMYRKLEAEKRKFEEGVNCMQQIQLQQNMHIQEKQTQNVKQIEQEKQLKDLQKEKTQLENNLQVLTNQLLQKTQDLELEQQNVQKLKDQLKQKQQEMQAQLEMLSKNFQDQISKNEGNNQQSLRRTQSEQVLEDKLKKLEYKNKQADMNFEALQQALADEVQKRQEMIEQQREKDDQISELTSDVKHLSQEMEAKEDEVMTAYQKYKKEQQAKDKEIENLTQTVQQLMEHVSSGDTKATPQEMKKIRQEIESEVLMTVTEDFMTQINALRQQLGNQSKEHEDSIFDKDAEIENMRQIISQKDAKIKEIQVKLDLTKQTLENGNNELGDFLDIQDGLEYQVDTQTPRGLDIDRIDLPISGRGSNIDSKRNSNAHLYNSRESGLKSPEPFNDVANISDIDPHNQSPILSNQLQISPEKVPKIIEVDEDTDYMDSDKKNSKSYSDQKHFRDEQSLKQIEEQQEQIKDLVSENSSLNNQLQKKEQEKMRLQDEVNNLKLVLTETSAQLMMNGDQKKVKELQDQLKNKDLIIEQLTNQIVQFNLQGNDQQNKLKQKVNARVSQLMQQSQLTNVSDQNSAAGSSSQVEQSPGVKRLSFRSSKLQLSGSFLHSDTTTPNEESQEKASELKKKSQKKGRNRGLF